MIYLTNLSSNTNLAIQLQLRAEGCSSEIHPRLKQPQKSELLMVSVSNCERQS